MRPAQNGSKKRIGRLPKPRIDFFKIPSLIDFSKHQKTSGLGRLHTFADGDELKGLALHAGLALTEKGLPLGLIFEKMWARQKQNIKGHEHTKVPMEEKES